MHDLTRPDVLEETQLGEDFLLLLSILVVSQLSEDDLDVSEGSGGTVDEEVFPKKRRPFRWPRV